MTRSALIFPKSVMSASVIPSAKNSSVGSPERLARGSTASERICGVRAVLPLANLSGDPTEEFFGEGEGQHGQRTNLRSAGVAEQAVAPTADVYGRQSRSKH